MSAIVEQEVAEKRQQNLQAHELGDIVPRLVSLEEFERLVEMSFFDEDERVELLDGIIVELEPVNAPHAFSIDALNALFAPLISKEVRIRIQSPIRLTISGSQPMPDVSVLHMKKSHECQYPADSDVLLVIEVADSSLAKDRNRKAELYARSKIQEYWIVNLLDLQLEIYRDPDLKPNGKGFFHTRVIYLPGQVVTALAFPNHKMAVAEMFPEVGSDNQ